ncbi:hypothetical protein BGW80DRAFT_172613 [Lactifluus volemus]|nr:hypothetical protein BGW80DRAFT_172613 [Lactifluus volemus]
MSIIRHLKLLRIKSIRLLKFARRVLNRKESNMVQGQDRISLEPRITISELPDNVLLDIFEEFLRLLEDDMSRSMAWHRLVHVCRRWRYEVFASPLGVDLRLLCKNNTPAKETLDIWPPLPIDIWSVGAIYVDNIIAALERPDRIRTVRIHKMQSLALERLVTVMQEPFPSLACLQVSLHTDSPALAQTFSCGSAPRLLTLHLDRIPFPTLPKFLLSCNDLSRLSLLQTPHSGYISPEAMVTCISTLTRLTSLSIGFESPASCPDRRTRHLPPLTRAVLAALTQLIFYGVSEYLEDLVARIDAPLLDNINIVFFNQLVFDIRQLPSFIDHAPTFLSYNQAVIEFSDGFICFVLRSPNESFLFSFIFQVKCKGIDWQLSSMEQICSHFSLLLSRIERLDIQDQLESSESPLQVDMDNTQWLELFDPFAAVRTLCISRKFRSSIASAFSKDPVTEVLPELAHLYQEEDQAVTDQNAFAPFITARRCSDHPIVVHRWERPYGGKLPVYQGPLELTDSFVTTSSLSGDTGDCTPRSTSEFEESSEEMPERGAEGLFAAKYNDAGTLGDRE